MTCCHGTGYADYAAVPCPDPACPVQAPRTGTWVGSADQGTHDAALALIDDLLACFVVYAHGDADQWTAGVSVRRDIAEAFELRRAALRPGVAL